LIRSLIPILLLCAAASRADNGDPKAILEMGGAASASITEGGSSGGPDLALEFTAIERWLEVEVGTSALFSRHAREWDTDVLFKKPWTLSERSEFMLGIGPSWVQTRQNNRTTNSLAVDIAADFMFWPSGKHRFGWFVEPVYEYNLGRGHEKSIGVSAGLLIAIR
jgi:hypothetical protein